MKLPVWIQDHQQRARHLVLSGVMAMLVSGLMAGLPATSLAQPQGGPVSEQAGPVNQEQALERVRANFPGTVISINEVRQNGRLRYRVRLDNEGNIYTVFVDQATGELSRE